MTADLFIVEATGLSVRREGRAIIDGVDLRVARGSIHAIIGPNGAGKSTLLAALLGHAQFTGSVRWHLMGAGAVGYVPQSFAVDRALPLTVLEFLALQRQRRPICLGIAKGTAAKGARLLERVGLAGLEARAMGALSGGELRRVLIANALDPAPELLLLDEPSTGLDRTGVALMEGLLTALRDDGTTVLLVSHESAQVRRIAEEVSWIDRTVKKRGSVAHVFGDRTAFPFAEGD